MTATTRVVAVLTTVAFTVVTMSGCQWLAKQAMPTPDPTPTATSAPVETAQERQMRLDEEAAEKAYLAADKEVGRLAMAGGATKPTKILLATTAGTYLKVQIGDLTYLKENGLRADRPVRSTVVADGGWTPTKIGLTACVDATKVRLLKKNGKELKQDNSRKRLVHTLTATKKAGVWKITDVDTKFVKSFEGEPGCQP